LRATAVQKRLHARQVEEARLLAQSQELLGELGQLQAARLATARWRTAAVALAVLLAGALAWLLWRTW
jgi:hypothetical protein